MKLMIHWNKTHCKQGKGKFKQNLKISICIGDILINKSDSQKGNQFITNTRIKYGDRSCDLTLMKIYFLPIGGDSKYRKNLY